MSQTATTEENPASENQSRTEVQPEPVKEETPEKAGLKAITKRGFKPDNPENYAYMLIESPNVDNRTGQVLSKPYPATFNEKDWIQFLQYRTSQNLEVREILHLPAGWKKPDIFEFHNK